MDARQFDQIASHIVNAHHARDSYSREFLLEWRQPPNLMAKVQHARSVLQATLTRDGRFELGADFMEFGRVEYFDLALGHTFVLRSAGAVAIEQAHALRRYQLFSDAPYLEYVMRTETLLIYGIELGELVLSLGSAESKRGSRRLELRGGLVEAGRWPLRFTPTEGPAGFDQGADDDFRDLDDDLGFGEGGE